jgi:site-specific DNA-methyltransferase (adenine-specific)
MPFIPSKSIDMILCDLPWLYGTTACKWDTIIPFEPLWAQYKRLIKDNGAIVLTASQPFTSALVMSNVKMFKYELIWEKTKSTGFLDCAYRPMRSHENICVFYNAKPTYCPQKSKGEPWVRGRVKRPKSCWGEQAEHYAENTTGEREPKSVVLVANPNNGSLHPTQKPVALFEYLIRTYTNEGDTVLDNCSGSGTTAIACINTNRKYICIEKDEKYFEIGKNRIVNHQPLLQAVNAWICVIGGIRFTNIGWNSTLK